MFRFVCVSRSGEQVIHWSDLDGRLVKVDVSWPQAEHLWRGDTSPDNYTKCQLHDSEYPKN
jgi:hypothetical protein